MTKKYAYPKCNVRFRDEFTDAEVRTVLAYEARTRGRHLTQTVIEMVREGSDFNTYPESVRTRISELEQAVQQEAAIRVLGGAA